MATDRKSGGKRKKAIRKPPGNRNAEIPKPEQAGSEDEIDRNEFGGLPDRDLKKNLGCG